MHKVLVNRPPMTIAIDLGRKATKQKRAVKADKTIINQLL